MPAPGAGWRETDVVTRGGIGHVGPAIRGRLSRGEWAQAAMMVASIAVLFLVGIVLLLAAIPHRYHISRTEVFGVGTGLLALTLGMRHAFDADHIAAIDNTTRKLMAEGKRPMTVGFFFALGHSTVVLALALLLNLGVNTLGTQLRDDTSGLHAVTGIIGTTVSGVFLYVLAALNTVLLVSIGKAFRDLRAGRFDEQELERRLQQRGLMNRFLAPLARRIDTPWKMYPVGLLFGLGFDTATEVALLVLSGTAVVGGLPFWAILCLPILFAAGMTLFDSIDGSFMNFAYGWAFSRPIRKVYYNLVITALSIGVAVIIGTIEILGLLGAELSLDGGFWDALSGFDSNTAGFVIIGLFAVTWFVAVAVWYFGRIEARWEAAVPHLDAP